MSRFFIFAIAAATMLAFGATTSVASDEIQVAALDRQVSRSEDFSYRIVRPQQPSGRTIVLLHGSGGNESSLVDIAAAIAPHATLVGIRGRVVQGGRTRWYKRLTPTRFDQDDIRHEADAFARFLSRTAEEHEIDLGDTLFLGYSNGANLIAAAALLHPGLVHRAALLRPMSVLDEPPLAALDGTRMLVVAGEADLTYAPFAPALETLLKSCGATVDARLIASDHAIGNEDARIVAEWLAQIAPGATADAR